MFASDKDPIVIWQKTTWAVFDEICFPDCSMCLCIEVIVDPLRDDAKAHVNRSLSGRLEQ